MITLALDASTYRSSVAVLDDARVLIQSTATMKGQDREKLMPAVAEALRSVGASLQSIGRVVCGAGPGSFTSLRIAASIAKGIAVGRSIPLYAVSSLALIVAGNVKDGPRGARTVDQLAKRRIPTSQCRKPAISRQDFHSCVFHGVALLLR